MERAKKATSYMALLGFLTALCGLLQTVWSTAPWWVEDKDPVPMATMIPHMIPMADDDDDDAPVAEAAVEAKQRGIPVGVWILAIGIVVGGAGLIVRLILPRVEKEVARRQEKIKKQLLL